ncbi:MAG: hypothetical protein ACRCTA_03085 [Bacilli bacterium]
MSAITGYITSPLTLDIEYLDFEIPSTFVLNQNYFIYPKQDEVITIVSGPNIKPIPLGHTYSDTIKQKVILKTGSNITTDDICPSNAKLLPYRSNIPKLANYCFNTIVSDFKQRALDNNGGIIIAQENYGQGSSREHAALLPLYLNIKAVIALSYARIHKANLVNNAILPLVFINEEDYYTLDENDELLIENLNDLTSENPSVNVKNLTKNTSFMVKVELSPRQFTILKEGGYLKYANSLSEVN